MQGIPHIASTPYDGRSSPVPPARREQHATRRTARHATQHTEQRTAQHATQHTAQHATQHTAQHATQHTAQHATQHTAQHTAQHSGRDTAQHMPHRMPAPRVNPAARRSQADAPQLPVFIDQSGWRRRTLQGVALAVGCACLGYLLAVGALISGLRQPVGTHPPSTNVPAPSGPDTGKSQRGHDAPDRAGTDRAKADRAGTDRAETDRAKADRAGTDRAETDRAKADRAGTDRAEADRAEADRSPARAVADRDDHHHRPPPGRSVPSAGGPKQ